MLAATVSRLWGEIELTGRNSPALLTLEMLRGRERKSFIPAVHSNYISGYATDSVNYLLCSLQFLLQC